jgi:L-lactate dehydrogenase complex protein LldG
MTGTDAKAAILGRIRTALADRPEPAPVLRDYRRAGSVQVSLEQFIERVTDYKATMHRGGTEDDIASKIRVILSDRGISPVAVPDGFPQSWLPDVAILREPLTIPELGTAAGVLSSCALAIAETGTIVLDAGPGQGPRALTLIPDYHLVVVRAEQVRASVPDAVGELDPTRPLTWISGPSATSDIELERVEGVHGPRTLDVLLIS